MVRRPIAVVLACLCALGGACAVPASAASPAAGVPAGTGTRGSPASRPDACVSRPTPPHNGHNRHNRYGGHGGRALGHATQVREPGPDEIARMTDDLRRRLDTSQETSGVASDATGRIMVPVRVHIIRDRALGLPDSAVSRQIAVLNTAYSGGYGGADTGVRFVLRGITHTDNRAWFRDPLGHETPMKEKLRAGGPETLNLYIAQLSRLVLGYSTYPYWYDEDPVLDGVVIDWRSVPGGPLRDFARGFTAVHEIGHWFGLLHTFENGCKAPGDSVDDTPAQAHPTNGCPARKDTCPAPGDDPVHNFMDYAQDRCMREFTAGQGVRIHQMWDAYRRPRPRGDESAGSR